MLKNSRRIPNTSAISYPYALLWGVWKSTLLLAIPTLVSAAILPEYVGQYRESSSAPVVLENAAVWSEYGLQASERAEYVLNGKTLVAQAYRLQDSTSALAAWQWKRPANGRAGDAKLLELTKLASVTSTGGAVALGNHLIIVEGYLPTAEEFANMFRSLPHQQSGPLPTLPDHIPDPDLLRNSERYITGPAALALFLPEVSPSTAAFHLGTEIQVANYREQGKNAKMALFSFPTNDAARDHAAALGAISNTVVKRSGPLVAVVFSPPDPNAAERLLSLVRYQAVVTGQEKSDHPKTKKDNVGNFMVNLFILIGIMIVFCLLSGVLFGGMRALFRRGGESGEGDSMITLHIDNH